MIKEKVKQLLVTERLRNASNVLRMVKISENSELGAIFYEDLISNFETPATVGN